MRGKNNIRKTQDTQRQSTSHKRCRKATSARLVLLFGLAFATQACAKTWNGSISSDWATDANWTPSGTPIATDNVVINGGTPHAPTLNLSGGPVTIGSLSLGTVSAATLTIANGDADTKRLIVDGNCTIGASGTLTHEIAPDDTTIHRMHLRVEGNLTIVSGGSVDVYARGYATGPFGGDSSGNGRLQSHGGQGREGRPTYGSITQPIHPGSSRSSANRGGGVIRLDVAGTLEHNGTITANGLHGSGGSIWIAASQINGAGSITAQTGRGGGGRIALYYNHAASSFSGTVSANAGDNAAAGTIYEMDTGNPASDGRLTVENNQISTAYTHLFNADDPATVLNFDSITARNRARVFVGANISADAYYTEGNAVIEKWSDSEVLSATPTTWWIGEEDGDWHNAANWSSGTVPGENDITVLEGSSHDLANLPDNALRADDANIILSQALGIANGITLTLNAPFDEANNWRFIVTSNFMILPGSGLTHDGNSGPDIFVNRINLEVGGNMSVYPGGEINADSKGFHIGPGSSGSTYASSHGGQGRGGSNPTYGCIIHPVDLGSSGGVTSRRGGGAIKLKINGTLLNEGTIISDSGAAAGSIWIDSASIAGNGSIQATGERGAGGRIALHYDDTNSFEGVLNASGHNNSAGGTIYQINRSSQNYGTLVIDNSQANAAMEWNAFTSLNDLENINYIFDEIIVTNHGALLVDTGDSLTLAAGGYFRNVSDNSSLTVAPGGAFTNAGTFILAGTGAALVFDGNFVNEPGSVFRYIGTQDGVDPVLIFHEFDYQTLEVEGPGQTFLWAAGATYTVHEHFRATGVSGNLVTLRSTIDGVQWYLNLTGYSGEARYVQVRDSNASMGKPVRVGPDTGKAWEESIDEGQNENWVFGPYPGTVMRLW